MNEYKGKGLAKWRKYALLWLFPPKCVGCGMLMPISEGMTEIFCRECHGDWLEAQIPADEQIISSDTAAFRLISLATYRSGKTDGVPERLIYHVKHRHEARVFEYVAKQMMPLLKNAVHLQDGDAKDVILTYPPRRRSAVRKDGFDQAKCLATAISKISGWSVLPLIQRTTLGETAQKTLGAADRAVNAASAYVLAEEIPTLEGKTVILVDDLYTTGATLRTCGALLQEAGATDVLFATVERTANDHQAVSG